MQSKLSGIFKEMARVLLKEPTAPPSSEAAHAALLLAHVAWNRSIGHADMDASYSRFLERFEEDRPSLWDEFKSTDPEALINELVRYKQTRHPHDQRHVIRCGIINEKVNVEWTDATKN